MMVKHPDLPQTPGMLTVVLDKEIRRLSDMRTTAEERESIAGFLKQVEIGALEYPESAELIINKIKEKDKELKEKETKEDKFILDIINKPVTEKDTFDEDKVGEKFCQNWNSKDICSSDEGGNESDPDAGRCYGCDYREQFVNIKFAIYRLTKYANGIKNLFSTERR